jgi:hypothetical protein
MSLQVLAEKLCEKFNNIPFGHGIYHYIAESKLNDTFKINGFFVSVCLEYMGPSVNNMILLKIQSKKIKSRYERGYKVYHARPFQSREITIDFIKEILEYTLTALSTYKLNTLFGSFESSERLDIANEEVKLFSILSDENECCVCNEPTFTFTKCNHHLCFPCWEKILSEENNKCPLCREDITCCSETSVEEECE